MNNNRGLSQEMFEFSMGLTYTVIPQHVFKPW